MIATGVRKWLTVMADEAWNKVAWEFLRPFLSAETSDAKAPATLLKHQIVISLPFIDAMRRVGIDPAMSLDLLLAREVNAWIHIPKDVYEYMRIYYQIRSLVYKEGVANRIITLYLAIWNDVDLALHHNRRESLLRVYQASVSKCSPHGQSAEDDLYRLLAAAIHRRLNSHKSLGLKPGPHKTLARTLANLDYLEPTSRDEEVAQFAAAISRLFFLSSAKKQAGPISGGAGTAEVKQEEDVIPRWPLGEETRDPGELAGLEIAIQRFLGEMRDPETFDQLIDSFSKLSVEADAGRWWFYKQLAAKYPLEILPKLSSAAAQVYPVELVPWEPGSNGLDRLNIFASSGRAAHPGLTRIYRLSGVDSALQDPQQPDLVIAIDTSGSMDNPNQVLSYAALGGTIAVQAYLGRGAEVAVYNFSSSDIVLDFTPDEEKILKHLVKYQSGGTTLNVSVLDQLLQSRPRSGRDVDILIITDLGIFNFDEVLGKLASYDDTHRIFVFAIGTIDDATLQRFEGTKVEIHVIQDKADLPKIVLGAVRETFKALGGGENNGDA